MINITNISQEDISNRNARRNFSDAEPVVCLHIPKTAGTSLRRSLEMFYGTRHTYAAYDGAASLLNWESLSDSQKAVFMFFTGHLHASNFERIVPMNRGRYVTFLRNPLDRIMSLYRHSMSHDPFFASNRCSLEDFVSNPPPHILPQVNNHQLAIIRGIGDYGRIHSGDVNLAIRTLESEYFFVGTTENFTLDFGSLAARLGLCDLKPLKENVSSGGESVEVIPKVKNIILEKNALDIALHEHFSQRSS